MSEERKDGGPAFPQSETANRNPMHAEYVSAGGMTLRDYFAAHAQVTDRALDNRRDAEQRDSNYDPAKYRSLAAIEATLRYEYADAMLRERSK